MASHPLVYKALNYLSSPLSDGANCLLPPDPPELASLRTAALLTVRRRDRDYRARSTLLSRLSVRRGVLFQCPDRKSAWYGAATVALLAESICRTITVYPPEFTYLEDRGTTTPSVVISPP